MTELVLLLVVERVLGATVSGQGAGLCELSTTNIATVGLFPRVHAHVCFAIVWSNERLVAAWPAALVGPVPLVDQLVPLEVRLRFENLAAVASVQLRVVLGQIAAAARVGAQVIDQLGPFWRFLGGNIADWGCSGLW